MSDDDSGVRKSAIGALKRLDMQSPRVTKMIIDGARDRDYNAVRDMSRRSGPGAMP